VSAGSAWGCPVKSSIWAISPEMRGDARHDARYSGPMMATEHGLTFARAGDAWKCVERRTLLMVRGDRYRIEATEREFPTLAAALAALSRSEGSSSESGAAPPSRTNAASGSTRQRSQCRQWACSPC